ncbi:MAG TPA: NAD(P)-dependent oxidoreductase [Opitutus sp.]|nr:NAD(P)-dependent oxidoreductase [Opitutus sp.]
MKIALLGATGFVGSHLLIEAQRRGHAITAIARRIESMPASPNVTPVKGDLTRETELAAILRGHEAVLSATKFLRTDAAALIRIVKTAGVPRWLVVGGAGSLEVAPGVALVDTPRFPPEYRDEALAGRRFLATLREEQELAWTFLSPSALLFPGERTGRYRVGDDRLLVNDRGESRISVADFAVAMIDELETPRHIRTRFTVGE